MSYLDNTIITNYISKNNFQIISSDLNRPWGGFHILDTEDSKETKTLFDTKIIYVLPTKLLSLQYHGSSTYIGHNEIWYTCTKTRILLSKKSVIDLSLQELTQCLNDLLIIDLEPNAKIFIPVGFLHALINPYDTNLYIIETRLSQIPELSSDRENHITRIYDQGTRPNTTPYPHKMLTALQNPNIPPHFHLKSNTEFNILINPIN